jgi:SanA protein
LSRNSGEKPALLGSAQSQPKPLALACHDSATTLRPMFSFLRRRRVLIALGAIGAVALIAIALVNYSILTRHRKQLYRDVAAVPMRDVALVLGANPVTSSGRSNLHFAYRMDAAAALFRAGKVRHLLVSGDNHRADYDEPTQMKRALIARGVPADAITCDYAGFRTLDSVVRARRVFGLGACTIVTQSYHSTRALEIAAAAGLDAVGFCTRDVPAALSLRTELREILARTWTMLDLYVWHRQPRFGGPYEPIRIAEL